MIGIKKNNSAPKYTLYSGKISGNLSSSLINNFSNIWQNFKSKLDSNGYIVINGNEIFKPNNNGYWNGSYGQYSKDAGKTWYNVTQ